MAAAKVTTLDRLALERTALHRALIAIAEGRAPDCLVEDPEGCDVSDMCAACRAGAAVDELQERLSKAERR